MSTRAAPPPDEVQLTQGGSADLDAVTEVMNAAFDERFGEAWTRSQCAGILPMPGVELVLARGSDGELAGFSLFRTVADEAELLLLAVEPSYRRRGTGQMLLDHVLERARQFVKEIRQLYYIGNWGFPWRGAGRNITGADLVAISTR